MNFGALMGGMGGGVTGAGAGVAAAPATQNPWGLQSLMGALGQMGGGGGQGQGGSQEQKKKSLDALLMLAQILQSANAVHGASSLGGYTAGFGGMR